MRKVFTSLKAKLLAIIGIILTLFLVSYVMVYNNRYDARDLIRQADRLRNLQLGPELLRIQYNSFLQNEVFSPALYQKEQSASLDSMEKLSMQYDSFIDSLSRSFNFDRKSKAILQTLRKDLQLLTQGNEHLLKAILERGFQQSGKAGDLYRQGEFLENYIASLRSPDLLKSWITIRKDEYRYNLSHSGIQMESLTDQSLRLKALVVSGSGVAQGLSMADRIRMGDEIGKYTDLALSLRNKDRAIGLGSNEGLIGNQLFLINAVSFKVNSFTGSFADLQNRHSDLRFILRILILLAMTGLVLMLFTGFCKNMLSSVRNISDYLHELVKGKLPEPLTMKSKDELNGIAVLLNEFVFSLREKVKFAHRLGNGKGELELKPLSNDDSLANALLELQVSLRKAAEEDSKYKTDEKKRAWSNEGLARFSEILRFQTSDIAALSDLIIKNLVKYLNANQGGVFIFVDDDPGDPHLELISAFAYDRKKYITSRVNIGEGLVGTCAQEKLPIFLTEIPDGYTTITSGLGESNPRSLLIVPLKSEEYIYGILEIASFNILAPYEIEFVEKLAESIASTFASLKINIHTNQLLEQSRRQAEEMAQQEEEMRQNLEELQATQEEAARKEAEVMSIIHAIDNSSMMMDLDMEGKIIEVNSRYCSVLKCTRDDLVGKNMRSICYFSPQTEDYPHLWSELRNGRSMTRKEEVHFNNHTYFLTQNYSPIFDQDHTPYKVLVIASNHTEIFHLEENVANLKQQLSSKNHELDSIFGVLDKAIILAELTPDGTILRANKNYLEITGYLEKEVISKNARYFLKPEELKQFDLIWAEVEKGKEHKGVVRRTKPTGEEYWLMSAAIPSLNGNGLVQKVYFIAQDITEKKLKYQVLEDANKEIERLRVMLDHNNYKE